MDKKLHVLNEIKRTTQANGNKPLGWTRFSAITGLKKSDWLGKAWNDWNSWGDALKEAGYVPNRLQEAYGEESLIQNLIVIIRKIGHMPVDAEIKREAARDSSFPNSQTFGRRLGSKNQRIQKIVDFCRQSPNEYQDVLKICEPLLGFGISSEDDLGLMPDQDKNFSFVYLMKSGKHYKIGCTNALDRRQYEIGIQLPEKIQPVHSIRTDDPSGIEAYWHNRFKDKRLNGEWFDLTAVDVRVFKKRKFM